MNNEHERKNFISFLSPKYKKINLIIILFLTLTLILFLSSNIFSQEDNNNNSTNNDEATSTDDEENSTEDTSENSNDENGTIEGDLEGEDDTESEDGDGNDTSYERTIEYDEEVSESDLRVYDRWIEHIEYGVSKRKENIIEWIKKTKKEKFVPLLTKILEKEKNPMIIEKAISAAIQLQYYESSEAIEQYLEFENKRVQVVAARALGIFKYEPLADYIEELIESDNKALKNEAIMGIGRLKLDNYTYELIDDIYYDPDAEKVHQESVIKALGMIGTEDACLFLLDIYEDEVNDTNQRALAFRGLILNDYGDVDKLLKEAIESGNLKLKSEALSAMFMFLEKEEIPMNILYASLKDDNAGVRMGGLRIIAKHKISEEKIIEFLKYMIINDPVDVIQYTSVGTYLTVAQEESLSFIEERMGKGDQTMRAAVTGLLHLLPSNKAIEYAEQELNDKNHFYNKTEKEIEQLFASIRSIQDSAGVDLLIQVAENPMDYEITKNSLKYYQMVIKELTKAEENDKIISAFKKLILEKKSITATSLYPDLYPDDLTSVMMTIITGSDEEFGDRMKYSAVYNIIQFGEDEDHLKLKNLYDKEDTPDKIKNIIKGYFRSVGIDVERIGEKPESTDDEVEEAPEDTTVEEITNNDDDNEDDEDNNSTTDNEDDEDNTTTENDNDTDNNDASSNE
jgi:HEAT repeat protein